MRRTRHQTRGPLLAGLLIALQGCRSADPALYPPKPGDAPTDVVVLNNHWHTSLIFAADDLPAGFRRDLGYVAESRYVAVGWGDEGFFRADHVTVGLIPQALFYSRGSVVFAFGFDAEPEAAFDSRDVTIDRVPTSRAGLDLTFAAAREAFARPDGRVLDAGPGPNDGRFFVGRGRYAWYHTCNQWTADCLAAGGLPVSPLYAATAGNVAFQLRSLPGLRRDGRLLPPPSVPDDALLRRVRGNRP